MKKLFSLLIVLVLVLTACLGGAPQPTPPAAGDAPQTPDVAGTPSGDPLRVDVFIYSFADTFIATVRDALAAELGSAGMDFSMNDANNDQTTQVDQIRTAITMGTDLLMVNIVSTGAEDVAMYITGMAENAGVPIIFFNREVSDAVINSYEHAVYVGTDAAEAGFMQGELIFNIISQNFEQFDLNSDGTISYIMFKGELGNPEAQGRTEYSVFQANQMLEAAGLPSLTFYDPQNTDLFIGANWSAAEAQSAMLTALTTNPMTGENPIEMIIANNDDMALGAIEALNGVGFNTGGDYYIPVFGVDATDAARDAISGGRMTGTIEQSATGMAVVLVFLAQNVQDGAALMDGTGGMIVDTGVDKIRIPHAMVS